MHAFDYWLSRRTLGFTAAATTAACVVVVLTDEAGSSAGMRIARLAALAPGLAALGAWLALGQASSRGELRALAALGTTPWRAGLGASMAGWLIGIASALVLCSPWADTRALFPAVSASATWLVDAGSFIEPFAGLRVLPSGAYRSLEALRPRPTGAGPGPFDALIAVGPLVGILPIWVTSPLTRWGRAAIAALSAALLILLLHWVAVRHAPAGTLVLASVPLGVHALTSLRAHRRACSRLAVRERMAGVADAVQNGTDSQGTSERLP